MLAGVSLAACVGSLALWVSDDGVTRPASFRVWGGPGRSSYFLLVGYRRLTVSRQDVTQAPSAGWAAEVTRLGNVRVRAGDQTVASVATGPAPNDWPYKWGRFHQSGPKVIFHVPGAAGPQVCSSNYSGLSIPQWVVSIAMAVPPALWLLAWRRRARVRNARMRGGLCLHCGYDLRGSPGRCPECGSVSHLQAAVTTS